MSGGGTKAGSTDYLLNFVIPRVVTENIMRHGFAPDTTPQFREEFGYAAIARTDRARMRKKLLNPKRVS
jgi:hypothetical protein